jgi:hypothetical protein
MNRASPAATVVTGPDEPTGAVVVEQAAGDDSTIPGGICEAYAVVLDGLEAVDVSLTRRLASRRRSTVRRGEGDSAPLTLGHRHVGPPPRVSGPKLRQGILVRGVRGAISCGSVMN